MYSKTYQSPTLPQRNVLEPNLHYGPQALTRERFSTILASKEKPVAVERTRKLVAVKLTSGPKDCPNWTVQKQHHTRKAAVQKLIHQLETHPNREALQADLKQNRAFSPFSEQSKEMIYSMGNMEYFEICEITPKVQCHKFLTYCTKGIVYCTCGTCLRPSDKIRKFNKDRNDVVSIPNNVIKKGPSHSARHGNTERQRIYHAAHVSSQKAKTNGHTSILDRFLPEWPSLSRITNQHRMERRTLRTLRCDCGLRSLLYRHSIRARQT